MEYQFTLDFKVRDYECDLQGIVNNAVYQNYLEHTRHEFLLAKGVDFAALARAGINLIVTRAELHYKASLTSGDAFRVCLNLTRKGRLRFLFQQDIYRASDDKLVLKAEVEGASVSSSGRPMPLEGLDHLFAQD